MRALAAGVHVDGHEQVGLLDARGSAELEPTTADHDRTVAARRAPTGDAIRVGSQYRAKHGLVGICTRAVPGEHAHQLVPHAQRLARRSSAQVARAVAERLAIVEGLEGLDGIEHVGRTDVIDRRAARDRYEGITVRECRGCERDARAVTQLAGGDQHARKPRMHGQLRHGLADGGDAALAHGAEAREQRSGGRQRVRGRCFEPGERVEVGLAEREELQHGTGQIGALDLRRAARREARVLGLAPEPDARARRGAARATSALVGRLARDAHRLEPLEADGRIHARQALETGVDDHAHAGDRERGLGHVRREDHPPYRTRFRPTGLNGGVLLLRRQLTVQRQHLHATDEAFLLEVVAHPADLAHPGEEHEDVPFASRQHVEQRRAHGPLDALF